MKKHFPNKTNDRKMDRTRKNRKISSEMKTLDGLMKFFQEKEKKLMNKRR